MATIVFYLDDGSTLAHHLEGDTTTIGRHPDSVVVLNCPSVSAHHATLVERDGRYYVEDHHSSNGTRLNGAEIEEGVLNDGDRLGFGDIQGVFYAGDAPAVESAAAAVPAPDLVAAPPPPPPMKAKYRPAPVKRNPRVRRAGGYPDTSENGCMTAVLVTCLFLGAFVIGLSYRHYKETEGGNFISDLANRLSSGIPKIKIERPAD